MKKKNEFENDESTIVRINNILSSINGLDLEYVSNKFNLLMALYKELFPKLTNKEQDQEYFKKNYMKILDSHGFKNKP